MVPGDAESRLLHCWASGQHWVELQRPQDGAGEKWQTEGS
jgi:hypothetical protein